MSQDSRTQPRVPQPPGLDPLSKVQSLSRDISKGIPAHVKKSVIASNAIDDFNPAKKHEVSDRSKNIGLEFSAPLSTQNC